MTQNVMAPARAASPAIEAPSTKSTWNRLLLSAGCYIIPFLPDILSHLLKIPSQMMANGYALDVKKGDFEMKFGKDIFPPAVVEARDEQKQ